MLVHFIFGLSDDEKQRHFGFSHYLSVRAAHVHLQPAKLLMHYHHLPTGPWWAEAAPLVESRRVKLPHSRSTQELKHAAHRADLLRLELLIAHGGVYLDLGAAEDPVASSHPHIPACLRVGTPVLLRILLCPRTPLHFEKPAHLQTCTTAYTSTSTCPDVIVVRSFAPLLRHEFVLAKEGDEAHGGYHGLCNAVLLARPMM